jgi:hypothetical protein
MRRPAAVFTIALALGAISLAPRSGAQAQDAREEGPRQIEKCQTISKSGSYKLVNDLTFKGTTGVCLQITANFVAIDLAGFTISAPGLIVFGGPNTTAIAAGNDTTGIAVRNGSISGFGLGVNLGGDGSIVEGLRVFGGPGTSSLGIAATGVVRGNTVVFVNAPLAFGIGISATGIVAGNYVIGSRDSQYQIGQGSTVIGNTALGGGFTEPTGFVVSCPSNVTDNTAINNRFNIVLNGDGCNNTNNVAP